MDDRVAAFIGKNHAAAMATLRPDGTAHVVRVGVGVADGKIWSSGTQFRLRTKHLRRDPRSTLFVFDTSPDPKFLSLETTVTILDGPTHPSCTSGCSGRCRGSGLPRARSPGSGVS